MNNKEFACVTIVLCPPGKNQTNWSAYIPEYSAIGICIAEGNTEVECLDGAYKEIRDICHGFDLQEPKKVLISRCDKVISMPKRPANEPVKIKHLLVFQGGR